MASRSQRYAPGRHVMVAVLAAGCLVAAAPAPVGSAPPEDHSAAQEIRGHVTASRRVELRAPLPEMLDTIEVKRGERVKAGQVLARLNDRLQRVSVEAARVRAESASEIRQAELDVSAAKHQLERVEVAFRRGAASDHELTVARIAAERAEAVHAQMLERHNLAKVQLKLEEERHARYEIRAPFDGIVLRVDADTGEMMIDEDVILVLVDLDTLEANIDFPATMYGDLELGRAYTIFAGPPVDDRVTAVLDSVDPIIDAASQTFRCVFTIKNRDLKMPAGFTVSMAWDDAGPGSNVQAADDTPRP